MEDNNKIAISTKPEYNPFLVYEFISKGEPKTVQLFDYIKNPLDKTMAKTLIRLYQNIPLFASYIFNEIIDRLTDDGKEKLTKTLKRDYPRVMESLNGCSKDAMKRYAEDESKYNCNTIVGELNLFEKFLSEFNQYMEGHPELEKEIWYKEKKTLERFKKFYQTYLKWAYKIESIVSVEDEKKYVEEIADKATFLYRLKKGDQFSFVDNPSFHEFTFVESKDIPLENGSVDMVCYYKNMYNETQVFYESNIYRPVIKTQNIFDKLEEDGRGSSEVSK